MLTVHMIFNAHIDPVWLWPWPSGLDAVLATCRNACDRLDAHPDLHLVRNEAWAYREVERIEPTLFERIRRHVEAGRWHIVGGWWLQPDCNGPGYSGLQAQIRLGRAYFQSRFGQFPRTAYNVDSFGHAATLPGLLRAHGQDRYIFMRPQEHQLDLPARLFRWRGYDDGPEVVAFRIAKAYTTRQITPEHVLAATQGLPPGLDHTMCFVGLGDHGGGPSEEQIAWCRAHENQIPGCHLILSHIDAFFDALADRLDSLPLHVGELQMDSPGCYSVVRAVKTAVHRAEDRLLQAAIVRGHDLRPEPGIDEQLDEAWRDVCFGHFHDTFGGTCIPSAYTQVLARVGRAQAIADEAIQRGFRRTLTLLDDDPHQRIVLYNASDSPYADFFEYEPWLDWQRWQPHWRLIDEQSQVVPHQLLAQESLVRPDWVYTARLLFPIHIRPHKLRVLRIDTAGPQLSAPAPSTRVQSAPTRINHDAGVTVSVADHEALQLAGHKLPLPTLQLIEDPTDTWGHNIERYAGRMLDTARWEPPENADSGPLMASLVQAGTIGRSALTSEWRVYTDQPFAEWRLRVHWTECHKVLKLTWLSPAPLAGRIDGITGGQLTRPPDGRERPARDWTLLTLQDGRRLGIVFPDVYALDASADSVRLTLLRSPIMAHHAPHDGRHPRKVYADQGEHEFRFRFFAGPVVTAELLEHQAAMFHFPPLAADLTRGMQP